MPHEIWKKDIRKLSKGYEKRMKEAKKCRKTSERFVFIVST